MTGFGEGGGKAVVDALIGPHDDQVEESTVEAVGSAGFVARGTLYLVIALIAGSVGVGGLGGGDSSSTGAIDALSRQPLGAVLLVVLAVGLAGYGLLRLLHIATNPSDRRGLSGLVVRASYAVQSLIYGGLAVYALVKVVGAGGGGGGQQRAIRTVLDLPGGVVIIGALGLVLLGVGVAQLWRAWTQDFMSHMDEAEHHVRLVRWAGVYGHGARGVLFGLIGVLLLRAAIQHDASEAGGIDEALDTVASSPYGVVLLLAIALGLAAYGLYCYGVAAWGRARRAS